MGEIVKYNNELNLMPMPKLKGTQHDLFFSIISLISEKHNSKNVFQRFFDPDTRKLEIPFEKFVNICRINDWKRNFVEVWNEIEDFLRIITDYKIEYSTKHNYYIFTCFEEAEHDKIKQAIKITFQKRFYDMVVNYKLGFTRFELAEFISLNGKYTKTLYRLLKQYRSTGHLKMNWQEFTQIMDIPKDYKMCDIDFRILKPAITELEKPKTLLDQTRIPFTNVTYTKLKGKGRGRGGNVIGIEFNFKPETISNFIEPQNQTQMQEYITAKQEKPIRLKWKENIKESNESIMKGLKAQEGRPVKDYIGNIVKIVKVESCAKDINDDFMKFEVRVTTKDDKGNIKKPFNLENPLKFESWINNSAI